MIKRIIVPTDFTEIAWNATIHALECCKILKTDLYLLNVFEYSANDLNINTQLISESIKKAENEMEFLVNKIKKNRKI